MANGTTHFAPNIAEQPTHCKGYFVPVPYQIRGWTPWHRFVTLAMLALAILATLTTAAAPAPDPDPHRYARQTDPITLTIPEIRRLLNVLLVKPVHDLAHLLHWSNWRRHHQAAARQAHYRRRLAT